MSANQGAERKAARRASALARQAAHVCGPTCKAARPGPIVARDYRDHRAILAFRIDENALTLVDRFGSTAPNEAGLVCSYVAEDFGLPVCVTCEWGEAA